MLCDTGGKKPVELDKAAIIIDQVAERTNPWGHSAHCLRSGREGERPAASPHPDGLIQTAAGADATGVSDPQDGNAKRFNDHDHGMDLVGTKYW